MKNEELIINLIHQDLKHNQLISGLERLGLNGREPHTLNIMEMVSELMRVPEGEIDDRWGSAYMEFMNEAINFNIDNNGESLKPLARFCYNQLRGSLMFHRLKTKQGISILC